MGDKLILFPVWVNVSITTFNLRRLVKVYKIKLDTKFKGFKLLILMVKSNPYFSSIGYQ